MSARAAKYRTIAHAPLMPCETCGYVHNASKCPLCHAVAPLGPPKAKRKPRHFEDDHQERLFAWIKLAAGADPDLAKLYHVPNGGARDAREGGRLKAQGVRAGQLDLNLDVARGGYFGLRIELKATPAELGRQPSISPEQHMVLAELVEDGYYATVCYGWEEARVVLLGYVRRPRTQTDRVMDLRP